MRVVVNEIPEQNWFSEKTKDLVDKFNAYAKKNKPARLMLNMYDEHETMEDLETALEEGMYDFVYPTTNPHSVELKEMVEEASKYPRYLGFDLKCLDI